MKKVTLSPAAAVRPRPARRTPAKTQQPPAKAGRSGRGITPATAGEEEAPALQSTTAPGPAQGSIKLEVSTMGPESVSTALTNLNDGLDESDFYAALPSAIRTAITSTRDALRSSIDTYAAAESWLRTLRAALESETNNGRTVLRTAAAACESIDRSDEALVSAGWELRRPAGRPRPVPAPSRFTLKNTLYEGEAEARWSRVGNAKFYEARVFVSPTGNNPDLIPWDNLPVIPVSTASLLFKDQPVGAWLTSRVRAVGARGPSPWTESTTVRIY